jgi:hypothetical protein
MDSIFLSGIPDSKGITTIQKLYASESILTTSLFNQYILLKISENSKILCKLVPQIAFTFTFGRCDASVINHRPNKLIDPLTVNLEVTVSKEHIEPICVTTAKRMVVSIIFKDVKYQDIWSKNTTKLADVVRHILRLYVVLNNCIVNLKKLGSKQNFNIDYILIHKTDCKNAARISSETSIMIIKTMSTIQFYHAEIGLEIKPLFGMEPQVTCLKNIIKAARNGCNPLCTMVSECIINVNVNTHTIVNFLIDIINWSI